MLCSDVSSSLSRSTYVERGVRSPALPQHFADADAEFFVDDDDFASGDQFAVGEDVDRVACFLVEGDDRAFAQGEEVFDEEIRSA
jgi:hypothetical protein